MRDKITTVYNFNELSETSKVRALDRFCDINVNYSWWEDTYEDAKTIGIKITEFTGYNCNGEFLISEEECIKLIKEEHGETCSTYKTAIDYERKLEICDSEEELEIIRKEFLQSLLEDYRIILSGEYEYLISDEAIIETIEMNEYEFLENGTLA